MQKGQKGTDFLPHLDSTHMVRLYDSQQNRHPQLPTCKCEKSKIFRMEGKGS